MHTPEELSRKGIAHGTGLRVMAGLMRCLPAFAVVFAALVLGGCSGRNDAVYTTRQMPTSSEDAYASMAKRTWSEDNEVYELPAQPPAIDDLHRPRAVCASPGQRMKPITIGGVANPMYVNRGHSLPLNTGRMSDRPDPLPLIPLKPLSPVAAFGYEEPIGAREPVQTLPVAAYDDRPRSQASSGVGRRLIDEALARTAEANVWCGEGVPPTSPVP
jgi:hypothetical protein